MPKYLPFEIGIQTRASHSTMVSFCWKNEGIVAEFLIPDDSRNVIRVKFDKALVVRILDEMPLSTEFEQTRVEGLVPEHFAYRVVDANFWQTQSNALKAVYKSAEHYRFITGRACLDVIANSPPTVTVMPAENPG